MKTKYIWIIIFTLFMILGSSCGNSAPAGSKKEVSQIEEKKVFVPGFNADSAYYFIEKQLSFGPRVPGSEAHANCLNYLQSTLLRFTPTVEIQQFKTRLHNGKIIDGYNIIASFQPEKLNRILLCAHWDSRPNADMDDNPDNHDKPLQGANDGASGVGVLLEIARQLSQHNTSPGIDILFFDVEDSGTYGNNESWALGSQYWSKNPHKVNYRARFGILLDMVGASDPIFMKEATSMNYAPGIMDKVWNTAARLGYEAYFKPNRAGGILDDHVPINENLNIPTIDIVHYDEASSNGFFEHWHTTGDDLSVIDPRSLKIVGHTVMTVIYEEK